jgi:hypothetical protein
MLFCGLEECLGRQTKSVMRKMCAKNIADGAPWPFKETEYKVYEFFVVAINNLTAHFR